MVGKEKKVEPVVEATEPTEVVAKEVAQPKDLNPEMEAVIAEAEKRGYGQAQDELGKEIERKEGVIKRLQERRQPATQLPSTDDTRALEFMVEAEKQRETESGVPSPLRPQLEVEVARRRQMSIQQKMWQDWQGEIQNQEDALTKKLEDAGIDPSSPEAIPVWDSFAMEKQHADFSFANKKSDLLIGKPKETKGEKKASLSDDDKEELERQFMEKHGLLKSETGGPSGGGRTFTREQIAAMPIEEFESLKPEIDKARKEGKIK